jgi:AraC family transcriptional regulator of arabinose operon
MTAPQTSFIHLNNKPDTVNAERFRITVVGFRKKQQNLVEVAHGHEHYLIVLFYDPVRLSAHSGAELCAPNSLVIYDLNGYRYYGNTDTPWSHSWFRCGGTELDHFLRELQLPLQTALTLPNPLIFEKYLLDIDQEIIQQTKPSALLLRNFLFNCLFELKRSIEAERTPEPIPQPFLELKSYIELNYCQKITLEDLVSRIHMSAQYVCRKFKFHFGVTPIDYAIRLKMQLAAALLRDHHMPIKSIAGEVGVPDVYYFSKLFKMHFGTAPGHYRASLPHGRTNIE